MEESRPEVKLPPEAKLSPTDLDGSLYASEMNDQTYELFDELSSHGYKVGLSTTNFEYKSPFVRIHGREIVGASAIRNFIQNSEHRVA